MKEDGLGGTAVVRVSLQRKLEAQGGRDVQAGVSTKIPIIVCHSTYVDTRGQPVLWVFSFYLSVGPRD